MMIVEQLMNQPAIVCHRYDSAKLVAALMREHDCGAIPVVDRENRLVGIVTDRDVCMAAYEESLQLRDIIVADIMTRDVVCCRPKHTINMARRLMERGRIRRLPVVDEDDCVIGLLSTTDMVQESAHSPGNQDVLSPEDIVHTLAIVSKPRRGTAIIESEGQAPRTP